MQASSKHKTTHSQIPVVSPVPVRSTLPSSLSLPYLALGPPHGFSAQSHHPSVASTPRRASPPLNKSTSSLNSPNSSIPTFRSLRNLFGPNRTPSSGGTPGSSIPKPNFGSIRRSITGERKSSATIRPIFKDDDTTQVVNIEPSPHASPNGGHFLEMNISRSTLDVSFTSESDQFPLLSEPPSPMPQGMDLSTIIEADTSGISKHLPPLSDDDREPSPLSRSASRSPYAASFEVPALRAASSNLRPPSTEVSVTDDSALDLSISKLDAEVRGALGGGSLGPHYVVEAPLSDGEDGAGEGDVSFNLGALDPELAALLSPNRYHERDAILDAANAVPPPPLTPPPREPSPLRSVYTAPESPPSPRRPSLQRPKTSPDVPKSTSSTSLSRLSRLRQPPNTPSVDEASRRASVDIPARRKLYSPLGSSSNLPSGGMARRRASEDHQRIPSGGSSRHTTPSRPSTSTADDAVSVAATDSSRFTTPARPSSTRPPPSNTRPSLQRLQTAPSATGSESGSHAPSAMATRRSHRPRASMENLSQSASSNVPSAYSRYSGRRRTNSLTSTPDDPSHYRTPSAGRVRPAMDLLGPRARRAFTAAGLMDNEGTPRDAGMRSISQQDYNRTAYAGSRLAQSEAAWGRTLTPEAAHGRRPSLETSPTAYSGVTRRSGPSTTYTSVSARSDADALKEKHQEQTEALLAALADSQRTVKELRTENDELKGRMRDLEDRLGEAMDELRMQRHQQQQQQQQHEVFHAPSQTEYVRTRVFERRPGSSAGSSSRATSVQGRVHARTIGSSSLSSMQSRSSLEQSSDHLSASAFITPRTSNGHVRRSSATSSVFPLPPSNMSMLLGEGEAEADRSDDAPDRESFALSTPPSPTLVYRNGKKRSTGSASVGTGGRLSNGPGSKMSTGSNRHVRQRSVSSIASLGNVSLATVNYSMLTGSPGSLNLRPEHDRHLLDMDIVSLNLGGSEDDSGRDGDEDMGGI